MAKDVVVVSMVGGGIEIGTAFLFVLLLKNNSSSEESFFAELCWYRVETEIPIPYLEAEGPRQIKPLPFEFEQRNPSSFHYHKIQIN